MTANFTSHGPPPPLTVLLAFGTSAPALPIAGGQSTSYTDSDRKLVFKPEPDAEFATFCAETLSRLPPSPAYRIPTPLRSKPSSPGEEPTFILNGWSCAQFVSGKGLSLQEPHPLGSSGKNNPAPTLADWAAVLKAARVFHLGLKNVVTTKPSHLLDKRTHRWARAERFVFGEDEPFSAQSARDQKLLSRLDSLRKALSRRIIAAATKAAVSGSIDIEADPIKDDVGSDQLVHGDLAGNVLLPIMKKNGEDKEKGKELAPAIIDFTPIWRPVAWSEAMLVADGILWFGAGAELAVLVGVGVERLRMLVRALMFRWVCECIIANEVEKVEEVGESDLNQYLKATSIVEGLIKRYMR